MVSNIGCGSLFDPSFGVSSSACCVDASFVSTGAVTILLIYRVNLLWVHVLYM